MITGGNNNKHKYHDETINMVTEGSKDDHHADTPRGSTLRSPLAGSATPDPWWRLPKLSLSDDPINQGSSITVRVSLSPKDRLDNLMRRWLHDSDAFFSQLGDFIYGKARERRGQYRLASYAIEDDLTPLRKPFENLHYQVEVYCLRHLPGYNLSREVSRHVDDGTYQPTPESLTPAQIITLSESMEICLQALARVRGIWWNPESNPPPPNYSASNSFERWWSYKSVDRTPNRIPDAAAAFASGERRMAQVLSGESPSEIGADTQLTPPYEPTLPEEMSGAIVDDGDVNTGGSVKHGAQDLANQRAESSRRASKLQMSLWRRWLDARFRAVRPLCELSTMQDRCLRELEDILVEIEEIPGAPTTNMSLLKYFVRGRIQKIQGARKGPILNQQT